MTDDRCSANKTIGQIATYVAIQMGCQYRTHAFLVLIVKDYARLTRCDRSGVIFSGPIYYNAQPELLDFFERYNVATPEVRGNDRFVSKPAPDRSRHQRLSRSP
jgi:hypothetical protein